MACALPKENERQRICPETIQEAPTMGRTEGETGFGAPEADTGKVSVKEGARALVAETVEPVNDAETIKRPVRPDAAFVTHLIATAAGSPQTRASRRAGPEEAAHAYGAAPARPNRAHPGRAGFSRLS